MLLRACVGGYVRTSGIFSQTGLYLLQDSDNTVQCLCMMNVCVCPVSVTGGSQLHTEQSLRVYEKPS